jgi:hypothetical protein
MPASAVYELSYVDVVVAKVVDVEINMVDCGWAMSKLGAEDRSRVTVLGS